jgi:hypothetical protein
MVKRPLDILKIDIEGGEWRVLGEEILNTSIPVHHLPWILVFELHTEGSNAVYVAPEAVAGMGRRQVKALIKSITKENEVYMGAKQTYTFVSSTNEQSKEDDINQFARLIPFMETLRDVDPGGYYELEVTPLTYDVDGADDDADEFYRCTLVPSWMIQAFKNSTRLAFLDAGHIKRVFAGLVAFTVFRTGDGRNFMLQMSLFGRETKSNWQFHLDGFENGLRKAGIEPDGLMSDRAKGLDEVRLRSIRELKEAAQAKAAAAAAAADDDDDDDDDRRVKNPRHGQPYPPFHAACALHILKNGGCGSKVGKARVTAMALASTLKTYKHHLTALANETSQEVADYCHKQRQQFATHLILPLLAPGKSFQGNVTNNPSEQVQSSARELRSLPPISAIMKFLDDAAPKFAAALLKTREHMHEVRLSTTPPLMMSRTGALN